LQKHYLVSLKTKSIYLNIYLPVLMIYLAHREEGNRIIREFLIGERNVELTTQGVKSDK